MSIKLRVMAARAEASRSPRTMPIGVARMSRELRTARTSPNQSVSGVQPGAGQPHAVHRQQRGSLAALRN